MDIDEYISSVQFRQFADDQLRKNACEIVEEFLRNNQVIDKTQLYSMPAAVQAGGLNGLKFLIENQRKKNSKIRNKQFWEFLFQILFAQPGAEFSLRSVIAAELIKFSILEDESKITDKRARNQLKKQNREKIEKVMNHALPIFIEHFNCHYFYKIRLGAAL